MIAAAVTPLSAEIILLQFALATTLDGICALIALKFCRAQCKSRRFATETRLDATVRYYTGNFRFWCARPLIADSSLCPAITRTPSSIRAITLCAVQDCRKAMPFLRQA